MVHGATEKKVTMACIFTKIQISIIRAIGSKIKEAEKVK